MTLELCRANCPARSDSDEAGQFVGKRAGSAAAVAQKERSAAGATAKALADTTEPLAKQIRPPAGGPFGSS
jgi:hypothetical protein